MEQFKIIPNGKRIVFLKQCSPRDTGIPLKHDYIFIKEVDTPNGISYQGGDDVIHDFCYLGKGGGEGDKILKCYTFDLFTLSILKYSLNNTVIPCVFLPFVA